MWGCLGGAKVVEGPSGIGIGGDWAMRRWAEDSSGLHSVRGDEHAVIEAIEDPRLGSSSVFPGSRTVVPHVTVSYQ